MLSGAHGLNHETGPAHTGTRLTHLHTHPHFLSFRPSLCTSVPRSDGFTPSSPFQCTSICHYSFLLLKKVLLCITFPIQVDCAALHVCSCNFVILNASFLLCFVLFQCMPFNLCLSGTLLLCW